VSAAASPKACACNNGESCTCGVPRKRTPKSAAPAAAATSNSVPPEPTTIKVHYRPVLPRLAPSLGRRRNSDVSSSGPVHDPSVASVTHPHGQRQHLLSPYGRAYENEHGRALAFPHPQDAPPTHIVHEQPYAPPQTPVDRPIEPSWLAAPPSAPGAAAMPATTFVSASCGCGPNCTCPGCTEHMVPGQNSILPAHAYDLCMDPQSCTACLQCSIMSMPLNATGAFGPTAFTAGELTQPPSQAAPPAAQYQAIDEWVRQIENSQPPVSATSNTMQLVSPYTVDSSAFPDDTIAATGVGGITSPTFEPAQYTQAGWPTDAAAYDSYFAVDGGGTYARSEASAYPPSEPSTTYPPSESVGHASSVPYARSEPAATTYATSVDLQTSALPSLGVFCRDCRCPPGQCMCDDFNAAAGRTGLTFATSGERCGGSGGGERLTVERYLDTTAPVASYARSYDGGSSSSPSSSRRSSHSGMPIGGITPFTPLRAGGNVNQHSATRTFEQPFDEMLY
jgi:hypothetical protein